MSQALSVTLTAAVKAGAFAFGQIAVEDDTCVIGDVTYTFRDAVGATINQVLVGTDVNASVTNLVAAINDDGVAAQYGTLTVVNPYVSAEADLGNDEVDLTPRLPGVSGNAILLAETGTALTAGGACMGLVSGTDSVGSIRAYLLAIDGDGLQPNTSIDAVVEEFKALSSAVA